MYDYRKIEERNKELQGQLKDLSNKQDPSVDDMRRSAEILGAIHANDQVASELREAELEELRNIVKNGRVIDGGMTPEKQQEVDAERAFRSYLRGGEDKIPSELRTALVAGTDANGGYVVPEPVHGPMIELARKYNPIWANATLFELTGDTKMYLPYKATHGVATTATETGARSEQTEPTLGAATLECFDYYSDQRATQTFIDSAIVNGMSGEEWLMGEVYKDIIEKAEYDAVIGAGSTALTGMFSTTAQSYYTTSLSASADTLVNTAFLKWFFELNPKYRANAKWVMNSSTLATVAGYVWPNTQEKLVTISEDTGTVRILGKEVLECESAPSIGASAFPVAFGDIKQGYAVGIHRSVSILRDPYTATPKIRYYGLGRLGGVPWNPKAIILGKSDNA